MAKRVIWSSNTDQIYTKILEYYIERNGSKTYSQKLNYEILAIITILSKQSFLGLKTDNEKIRVFIKVFNIKKPRPLSKRGFLISCLLNYACEIATATATVAPTIGLLPIPINPIIST